MLLIWTEVHFWIGVFDEVKCFWRVEVIAGIGPAKEAANSCGGFCQEGAQASAFLYVSFFRECPGAGVSAAHCVEEDCALFSGVGECLG